MPLTQVLKRIDELAEKEPYLVIKNSSGNLTWRMDGYKEVLLAPPNTIEETPTLGWLKLLKEDEGLIRHDTFLFTADSLLKLITVYQEVSEYDPSILNALVTLNATIDPSNGEPNHADRELFFDVLSYPYLQFN